MMQKTKLRTYRILKQTLTFEQYLNSKDRQARQTMTRLREGTNELIIEEDIQSQTETEDWK